MHFIKMRKSRFIYAILFICLAEILHGQNEANIWHFGFHAGLDFNSGNPVVLGGVGHYSNRSNATISDSLGNFMFSFSGTTVWNRNGDIMQNGDDIVGHNGASQGALIVPMPGSNSLYYVFSVSLKDFPKGFHYSRINMNLDNGLGGVEASFKNIKINMGDFALEKITAVVHSNNRDIWVITRIFPPGGGSVNDAYLSYLLTSGGLNTTPVVNEIRHIDYVSGIEGSMKISPDKKYLVTAYNNKFQFTLDKQAFDICWFNANTGEIEFLYSIGKWGNGISIQYEPYAVEFSPDSKLMYLTYFNETDNLNHYELFQYDMQYIDDSIQFKQSEIYIDSGQACGLQLARDGRIYGIGENGYGYSSNMGVINRPWERGTACDFQNNALSFGNQNISIFFQNIMLDYLYRFEWEGSCSGTPIKFNPNFINPLQITWDFGDGSPTVTATSPEHIFNAGGEYEVHATVKYYDTTAFMDQRTEETSRVVTVLPSPTPNLGNDTIICEGTQLTLNAGNIPGIYTWSNDTATIAFGPDKYEITVSDTGNYMVRISNSSGCSGYDTIHVSWHPGPQIEEQNLQIQPTVAGGATGSITGLEVTGIPPLSFIWYDDSGNIMGNTLDLTNLEEGNYYLEITDGNGCVSLSQSYTISSGNILIDSVDVKHSHCRQDIGRIIIYASSQSGGPFEYSIDNAISWQSNNTFTNLSEGSYYIRAKETGNGETPYWLNPVEILDIAGPRVTNVSTTPETNHTSDGEIIITATTTADSLWYSINNGQNNQYNDGYFNGLSAGIYLCRVKDNYNCDTVFAVEVISHNTQLIEAIAGDGYACKGNTATNPLIVSDFKDVKRFNALLEYDSTILTCEGYDNIVQELEDGITITTQTNDNKIYINWEGVSSLTLPDNTTILELVFKCNEEGYPGISWEASLGESNFYNESGEEIPANYTMGRVRIFARPEIILGNSQSYCEDDEVNIWAYVEGGSGEFSYHWAGPQGYSTDEEYIWISGIQTSMQGTYNLTVTDDSLNCVESKSMDITVNQGAEIAFSGYDTLWVEPGFILDAGTGAAYYLWNTGETAESIVIDSMGNYSVALTSIEGCKSTDTIQILWAGTPFYIPNAFTPNGDGLNDSFKAIPRYDYVSKYYLSIYNRWGQRVYETTDINKGWDGTYKGSPCMLGAYIYRIVYKESGQQPVENKVVEGTVMLVR